MTEREKVRRAREKVRRAGMIAAYEHARNVVALRGATDYCGAIDDLRKIGLIRAFAAADAAMSAAAVPGYRTDVRAVVCSALALAATNIDADPSDEPTDSAAGAELRTLCLVAPGWRRLIGGFAGEGETGFLMTDQPPMCPKCGSRPIIEAETKNSAGLALQWCRCKCGFRYMLEDDGEYDEEAEDESA